MFHAHVQHIIQQMDLPGSHEAQVILLARDFFRFCGFSALVLSLFKTKSSAIIGHLGHMQIRFAVNARKAVDNRWTFFPSLPLWWPNPLSCQPRLLINHFGTQLAPFFVENRAGKRVFLLPLLVHFEIEASLYEVLNCFLFDFLCFYCWRNFDWFLSNLNGSRKFRKEYIVIELKLLVNKDKGMLENPKPLSFCSIRTEKSWENCFENRKGAI